MTVPKKPTTAGGVSNRTSLDNEWPESAVRTRARNRMRELLVASSALGLLACKVTQGDPLPPPLRCSTDSSPAVTSSRVSSKAAWTQTESGLVLRVEFDINTDGRDDPLAFAGDPVLTDATLVHVDRQPGRLVFDCRPTAGATRMAIVVPLSCSAVASCFRATLEPGQPEANRRVWLDWPFGQC